MSLYQIMGIRDKGELVVNHEDEDDDNTGIFDEKVAEWHNEYELDEWMRGLRNRKGVDLTREDIDKLEADMPNLKEFCVKAREVLKEDKIVFYNGWR